MAWMPEVAQRRSSCLMPGVKRRPPHLDLAGCARQVREPRPGFQSDIGQPLLRCLNPGIHALAMSTPATRPVVPDSPPHRGPG
jgi:hypothetical protein